MAPVLIEWRAVSNSKRKLVWIACKQVPGGYARLSPSFPPTDADPSSWTPIYQHGHQPIIMVTNL